MHANTFATNQSSREMITKTEQPKIGISPAFVEESLDDLPNKPDSGSVESKGTTPGSMEAKKEPCRRLRWSKRKNSGGANLRLQGHDDDEVSKLSAGRAFGGEAYYCSGLMIHTEPAVKKYVNDSWTIHILKIVGDTLWCRMFENGQRDFYCDLEDNEVSLVVDGMVEKDKTKSFYVKSLLEDNNPVIFIDSHSVVDFLDQIVEQARAGGETVTFPAMGSDLATLKVNRKMFCWPFAARRSAQAGEILEIGEL